MPFQVEYLGTRIIADLTHDPMVPHEASLDGKESMGRGTCESNLSISSSQFQLSLMAIKFCMHIDKRSQLSLTMPTN